MEATVSGVLCNICGHEITDENRKVNLKTGEIYKGCTDCLEKRRKYQDKARAEHPEDYKSYQRSYYAERSASDPNFRARQREYHKKYREEHRVVIREQNRQQQQRRRDTKPDVDRAYKRNWARQQKARQREQAAVQPQAVEGQAAES